MAPELRSPNERATAVVGEDAVGKIRTAGLGLVDAKALQTFLRNCGDESHCSSCGALIYWFLGKPKPDLSRSKWPIDENGGNHFGSCPNAAAHRKPKP